MLAALLIVALVLAIPAHAQAPSPPVIDEVAQPPTEQHDGGVSARLALAHRLIEDLLDQYSLAAGPWDREIPPLRRGSLATWTVPVADEAAGALGALVWLRPEAADPLSVGQARSALAGVYDNIAWDRAATEQALVMLSASLKALAASIAAAAAQQQARGEAPATGR